MSGWFKLDRDILEHDVWIGDTFSRGQAWVDLIGLASFKAGVFRKHGVKIKYNRGDVTHSMLGLADRWGWSDAKVKRFLKELENDEQITTKITNVTTLISITNYEKYQGDDGETTNKRRTNDEQTTTLEEGKEGKEEISFVRFWDLVPKQKKQKRKDTEVKWSKLNDTDRLAALSHYPAFMAANSRDGYRYAPGPLPYINQRRWEDDDITPIQAPRKKVVENLGAPKSDLIWE